MLSRTSKAFGPTPRSGTFAGLLSVLRGSEMMTTSSGESSACPSARRATCGIASSSGISCFSTALTFSDVAPFRITIAFCGDPLATSVELKPCAIDSVITNTATTIAMPMAVIAAVPLRTSIERKLYEPTRPISVIGRTRPVLRSRHAPQRVHDLQPGCHDRREQRREKTDQRAQAQTDRHVSVADAERRNEP